LVVADQCSTDGTFETLQATPGVTVVRNDSSSFDEQHRQQLLLGAARRFTGRRILFGLDADEAFSSNCTATNDWVRIMEAPAGTVIQFQWVNILPGFREAWVPSERIVCGFVDNGAQHEGRAIHSSRVPLPKESPVLKITEFVILHFQYLSWERMRSKHRWYQTWEYLHNLKDRPLDIYRCYNHMYGSWEASEIQPVRPEWLEGYDRAGIDFRSLQSEAITWWDREMVALLREHGPGRFRKLPIWDVDWNAIARKLGPDGADLSDPRSMSEKMVHQLLRATQKYRTNLGVRAFERFLRMGGW
jgi:hypothetical protein